MLSAVPISRILLLGIFPGMIAGMTGLTLSAIGGIWDRVKIGIFVIIFHLIFSRLLIPKFGASSAAFINLFSQMINAALLYLILHKKFNLHLPYKQIGKMTLVGLLITGVIPFLLVNLNYSILVLLLSIITSGAFYIWGMKKLGFTKIFYTDLPET